MNFGGQILILGYGSVAQCFIPLLIKYGGISPKKMVVLDALDKRELINEYIQQGVQFFQVTIDQNNYQTHLSKYLKEEDILIDLALNIATLDLLQWCYDHSVYFLNSALISWSSSPWAAASSPEETLEENLYLIIQKLKNKLGAHGPTAVITHGANPGLSAHFIKKGLTDIAIKILEKNQDDTRKKDLEEALHNHNYMQLAYLEGIKTIHISEHDRQLIHPPKKPNEFVNTWSPFALMQECMELCQLGWGTHELQLPPQFYAQKEVPNYISLPNRSLNMLLYSWIPAGNIIGMLVPHEDIFELTVRLSNYTNGAVAYSPTICYVYRMCDSAIISLQELAMRQLVPQETWRVATKEVIAGSDQLGALLMGHDFTSWWTGSIVTIEKANSLVSGQNACTIQVAAGLFGAFDFITKNPRKGICTPFDLPHQEVLNAAMPFLGEFISRPVDWSPVNLANSLRNYQTPAYTLQDQWQFKTFIYQEK